jgi:hypothetical protein
VRPTRRCRPGRRGERLRHHPNLGAAGEAPLEAETLVWRCVVREGPIAYPFFIGHDASIGNPNIDCHPITYRELLQIESAGARAVFKALQFVLDVP